MAGRFLRALRHAIRDEEFLPVAGAALLLIVIGSFAFALGEGWSAVDGVYFAVAVLTTTSVSDPSLVLDKDWMKVFAILFQLVGIGVLVELVRRLGLSFVEVRAERLRRAGRAPHQTTGTP